MNLYFNSDRSVFQYDPSLENVIWKVVGINVVFYEGPQVISASLRSGSEPEVTLDKVGFGDGYEQITESGINSVRKRFPLIFGKRRKVVVRALERFFCGEPAGSIYYRRPSEWFWWLPPEPWTGQQVIPIKVYAEGYKSTANEWDSFDVNVTFIESFEP